MGVTIYRKAITDTEGEYTEHVKDGKFDLKFGKKFSQWSDRTYKERKWDKFVCQTGPYELEALKDGEYNVALTWTQPKNGKKGSEDMERRRGDFYFTVNNDPDYLWYIKIFGLAGGALALL